MCVPTTPPLFDPYSTHAHWSVIRLFGFHSCVSAPNSVSGSLTGFIMHLSCTASLEKRLLYTHTHSLTHSLKHMHTESNEHTTQIGGLATIQTFANGWAIFILTELAWWVLVFLYVADALKCELFLFDNICRMGSSSNLFLLGITWQSKAIGCANDFDVFI